MREYPKCIYALFSSHGIIISGLRKTGKLKDSEVKYHGYRERKKEHIHFEHSRTTIELKHAFLLQKIQSDSDKLKLF